MKRLLTSLWSDDGGAVLTTEYLALGGIVALGTANGLATIRDSVNDECKDFGQAVHQVTQSHRPAGPSDPALRTPKADGYDPETPGYTFMTP